MAWPFVTPMLIAFTIDHNYSLCYVTQFVYAYTWFYGTPLNNQIKNVVLPFYRRFSGDVTTAIPVQCSVLTSPIWSDQYHSFTIPIHAKKFTSRNPFIDRL